MINEDLKKDITSRMDKAINALEKDLKSIRTGRASLNLLDPVQVDAYGSKQYLTSLASISVSDARTIHVQVWDKSNLKAVEKAIVDSNLGLTPQADGQNLRINVPPLTEERRKELAKLSHKYGENAKIAIRNIRQSGNDDLKKQEKSNQISEDELKSLSVEIQKLTDQYNKKIDSLVTYKEKEILTI